MLLSKPLQQRINHGLVAMPFMDERRMARIGRGQSRKAVGEESEGVIARAGRHIGQDHCQRSRRQREGMLLVANPERAVFEFNMNLPRGEHFAVLISQHGDEHLVLQLDFGRLPIDVEPRCVAAGRPVLQHVPPVEIFGADRHVIGNDVQHLPHAEFVQAPAKLLVPLFASQFLVDSLVIDDVITVHASRCGLQVGRTVDVGNAQTLQIRRDLCRMVKRKSGIQLQTIGG